MRLSPRLLAACAGVLLGACGASQAAGRGPSIGPVGPSETPDSFVDVTVATSAPVTPHSSPAAPTTTRAPRPEVTDNRVYVVGDSIAESISSRYSGAVCDVLSPLGWNVTVDAVQGRRTDQAVQSLRAHRSGVGQVVVVLIGHNDGVDPDSYRRQMERLIDLIPNARRILLLTNYEFERGRDRMNEVLRELADDDGTGGPQDRIELVDWNAAVEQVDGAIRGDGVHLTSNGQEALADTIAEALGPAPKAASGSRKLICTTLRNPTSPGSGGSRRPSTTTVPSGDTSAPATDAPSTDAPPDTSGTGPTTTVKDGKPPPSSGPPGSTAPPGTPAPPPASSTPP